MERSTNRLGVAATLTAGLAIALGACASSGTEATPEAIRGLDFQARVATRAREPLQLGGSLLITNHGRRVATLKFPNRCVALLRAYEPDGPRVAPVWDQSSVIDCPPAETALGIDPGQTLEVPIPNVGTDRILGDSLPAGSYRLTAYLAPNGHVVEIEAGVFSLAVTPRSR